MSKMTQTQVLFQTYYFKITHMFIDSSRWYFFVIKSFPNDVSLCTQKPAGIAKWIALSLVNPAARDRISLLPKVMYTKN